MKYDIVNRVSLQLQATQHLLTKKKGKKKQNVTIFSLGRELTNIGNTRYPGKKGCRLPRGFAKS